MRNFRLLLASAVLFVLGCSAPSQMSDVEAGSDPGMIEAAAKATEFWHGHVGHCGQSYYIVMGGGPFVPRGVVELKDVSFRTVAKPVTAAEKLNGRSWQGYSRLQAKVNRKIYFAVQSPQWTPWVDGGESILEMAKTNGQWSLKPNIWGFPASEAAPECGWIARIGEGRTPTKTIASHHFEREVGVGNYMTLEKTDLTLTDVNFTLTFGDGRDPIVVGFWYPSFELSVEELQTCCRNNKGYLESSLILSNYASQFGGAKPIWIAKDTDRAAMEKVRQEILDAQAEWRRKYPN